MIADTSTRVSSDRLRLLRAIAHSFQRATELRPILHNVLRLCVEVLQLHAGWIFIVDENGVFRYIAGHNVPEPLETGLLQELAGGACYCQRLLMEGRIRQALNVVACERLRGPRPGSGDGGRPSGTKPIRTIRNHVSVPLQAGDRLLGVMNLAPAGDKLLGDQDLDFLSVVGQLLGLAIHRTQLYDQVRASQVKEQETIFEFSKKLLDLLEPSAVAQATLAAIRSHYEASSVSLFVAEGGDGAIQLIAGDGWAEKFVNQLRLPVDPPSSNGAAWSLHARIPVVEDPFGTGDFKSLHLLREHGIRMRLNVPMILQNRSVGVICVDREEPGPYSEEEFRSLSVIANLAATALEKARLYGAIQRQLRRVQGLAEVSQLMQAEEVPDTILESILRVAVRILEADRGGIFLHEGMENGPTAITTMDLPAEVVEVVSEPGFDLVRVSRLRDMEPWVVEDTWADPRLAPRQDRIAALGLRSYAVIPLVRQDRRVGSLAVYRDTPGPFDVDALRLAQTLADQAALTVERAKLLDQSYRQTRELAGLYEIAVATGSALDSRAFFHRLHDQVKSLINLDSFSAVLFHADTDELEVVLALDQGAAADEMEGRRFPLTHGGLTGWIMRMRRSLLVGDLESDPLPVAPIHGSRPARSWCGVPLIARGRLIGAVSVQSFAPNVFGEADLRFLEAVAGQVATALENARLLDETRRRAAQQEALSAIIAAAAAAPNLEDLIGKALDHSLRALGVAMGGMWVADHLVTRGLSREACEQIRAVSRIQGPKMSDTFCAEDWETVNPLHSWSSLGPIMAKAGVSASLYVPVVAQGRQIGGLVLAAAAARRWSEEEVALVEAVGKQLGESAERLALLETSRQQAQQLQRLLDTVQEGIVALDADRRVVLANPAGSRYLALLSNVGLGEILRSVGGRPVDELLIGSTFRLPYEVQINGGKPRVFEIYANPAPVGQESGGWMLLLHEVTEAREVQARIQLQERLAAVGQLAAGIAHDFNNAMAAIILYSEMLLGKSNLDAIARDRLGTILKQAERAAALTRQILDFSRRAVMEAEPMNLVPFLRELGRLLVRTLPESIHVSLETGPGDCVVNADPARLQQVLMNLAFNARDAMPNGGELRFAVHRLSVYADDRSDVAGDVPPGEWARITVSDTGVGIAPDAIPHIFEPFFTTKPIGRGTGLGLAQAYGIVKQHNGHIEVKSRLGEGSTFGIWLPALATDTAGSDLESALGRSAQGRGERILVVEDNPATGQAVADILESLGYQITMARNGRDALEQYKASQGSFDLVFTDLVMPEMGGMQLYRALRDVDPDVKVVLTTGYPLGTGTKELLGQGNLSWLQKPFNSEVLADCLRKSLDAPQATGGSTTG